MSSGPLGTDLINMPSESSFKQQAEAVRAALGVFNAIKGVDAPKAVKAAFDELVIGAADFQRFAPFFVTHALFLELLPATHLSLEEFLAKNPGFEKPPAYSKIAVLNARIKESLQTPVKKGMSTILIYYKLLSSFF